MVNALRETWRVLAANGMLVDLRPLSSKCPIEVVTPKEAIQIGEVDAYGAAEDDAAADSATRQAVEDGWYAPLGDTHFLFDFYWDTVSEMASFMEGSMRMKVVTPSYSELEKISRELNTGAENRTRLRCRRSMMLAVYRKADLAAR